jgi:hypothetical protein
MTLNGIAMKEKRNNIVIHCHLVSFKVDRRFGGERQEGNGRSKKEG